MSIASALANKQQQVADCYTAISNKGGTMPETQNLVNLATTINSITTSYNIPVGGIIFREGSSICVCFLKQIAGNVLVISGVFGGNHTISANIGVYKTLNNTVTLLQTIQTSTLENADVTITIIGNYDSLYLESI